MMIRPISKTKKETTIPLYHKKRKKEASHLGSLNNNSIYPKKMRKRNLTIEIEESNNSSKHLKDRVSKHRVMVQTKRHKYLMSQQEDLVKDK